jgi:hypothetical protein
MCAARRSRSSSDGRSPVVRTPVGPPRTPAAVARRRPASSTRVSLPAESHAISRAPRWIAPVCSTLPARQTANFVVPPPISIAGVPHRRRQLDRAGVMRGGSRIGPGGGTHELADLLREQPPSPAHSRAAPLPVVITAPASICRAAPRVVMQALMNFASRGVDRPGRGSVITGSGRISRCVTTTGWTRPLPLRMSREDRMRSTSRCRRPRSITTRSPT